MIHADHLSSATRITDAAGLEVRRLAYAAFGEEAKNQGSGDAPKYTYTGKEQDSSGLYYFGARYYDPALSRFITADTMYDAGPQGLNRYSYALNNPIIYRDPTGHQVNPIEVMFRGLRNSPVGELIGNRMRSEAQGVAEAVKKQIIPPEGTGVLEGSIPIWGDAKDSCMAIEQGSVTWGILYGGMALNDLVDGGVSPEDAAKAGLKGGQEVLEKATKEGGERVLKEGSGLIDEGGKVVDDLLEEGAKKTSRWTPIEVNGRRVYQRNDLFDPHAIDANGMTNIERMKKGRPPIGYDGEPVNLHHLTQNEPGALAEVGGRFHSEHAKTLHGLTEPKRSFRYSPDGKITESEKAFRQYNYKYWQERAKDF